MTGQENERLAIVETKVDLMATDIREMRSDLKALVASDLATAGRSKGRSDLGVWVRSVIPWVVMITSAAVTGYGILTR